MHDVAGIDSERPFHQKSSCLTQLTLGPYVVQIWSLNTPKTGPEQVVHEVEVVELTRKVDIRLSGKGNSNSHGAGPVY